MPNLNAGRGPQRSASTSDGTMAAVPLAEAMAECGEACTKGFTQWQDEVTRFAHARMQRNSELAESLSRCRDLNDMVGLQQEWLKAASQDYLQQTARMMGIASRITQDWMQPMTRLWANGGFIPGEPKPKG